MPVWSVSEPYINLHLYDEPISSYQPGTGPPVSFALAYKQRGSPLVCPNIYSLGTNWVCSWLSYVEDDGIGNQAILTLRQGGQVTFTPPDGITIEYHTHTTLLRQTGANGPNFVRTFPSGANDYYESVPTYVRLPDGHTPVFLTARTDPAGRTTLAFTYQEVPLSGGGYVVRLTALTDADGCVSTLSYTNTNPSLITGVTDPFGHFAVLRYDGSGRLTNITDAASLSRLGAV